MAVVPEAHVPEGARVVRVQGPRGTSLWLQYEVPNTRAVMAWNIRDSGEARALLGDNPGGAVDETVDEDTWHRRVGAGAFWFGDTSELADLGTHPFDQYLRNLEERAEVEPWLKDPSVLAVTLAARMEGRKAPHPTEIERTSWWRSSTPDEKAWARLAASNPTQARRRLEDTRRAVAEQLRQAGVDNAPGSLVRLLADRAAHGTWSESKLAEQVRKLSDPAAPGRLEKDVRDALKGVNLDTTQARIEDVRSLSGQWLGPLYGDWDDRQVNKWAGTLRNDPDGETKLLDHLRGQFIERFGDRGNPNITYEDLRQPAVALMSQIWGDSQPDERDPFFVSLLRLQDDEERSKRLRQEGLKRGVDKVVNDATEGLVGIFGQPTGVI